MVRNDTARKRKQRPLKIAKRKLPTGISKAAAGYSKSLKGVGGGIMAGIMSARN